MNAKNPRGVKLYLRQVLRDEDRKPDSKVYRYEAWKSQSGVSFSATVDCESVSAG